MLKISSKNTFILKEVDQPYRGDQILHMQLQQEAFSTICLGLPVYLNISNDPENAFHGNHHMALYPRILKNGKM